MRASIIIPYYKKIFELTNLLESLRNQTYHDFETIIINDGSDDVWQTIQEEDYSFDINYIMLERNEKSGRAYARNRGIDVATGEVLIFVDCDQIVCKDFVEKHIDGFIKNDGIIQFGTRKRLLKEIDIKKESIENVQYKEDSRHQIFRNYDYDLEKIEGLWHLTFTHNLSVSKALVDKFGGFDERFVGWGLEDVEFAYKLKSNGIKILYNPYVETFDQFERDVIDEEKRWQEWYDNFILFAKKYNNAEVWSQEIFVHNMNIERKGALIQAGIEKTWVYCFSIFEFMLQQIKKSYEYSIKKYKSDLDNINENVYLEKAKKNYYEKLNNIDCSN